MKNWIRSCAAIVLVLVCVGCSGGSGSGTGTSSGVSGQGTASSSTGGTIVVTDPASPIKGATVTVPPGAVAAGDVQISITHQDTPPGPLPPEAVAAGAIVVSKTIVLSKDRPGSFDQPLTITVPYDSGKLNPEDVPLVLYWDESTSRYSAVTVTNFNPTTGQVTFQTAHFSNHVVMTFKEIRHLLATCPSCILSMMPSFKPSEDGFALANLNSYSSPKANCLGMSSFAIWYFEHAKNLPQGKRLFDKYSPTDLSATATELIVRAQAATSRYWLNFGLLVQLSSLQEISTGLEMIQALIATGNPILFVMSNLTENHHAVVVYRYEPTDATSGTFYFYDPNKPGNNGVGIKFDMNAGFTDFVGYPFGGTPPQDRFYFTSYHSAYSPSDMQRLFDDAHAGWNEGQFGKITITSLLFDSTGHAAMLPSPDIIVSLKGVVGSSGGAQGYEPNHTYAYFVDSLGALTPVNDFPMTGVEFDIPFSDALAKLTPPRKLQSGANKIAMLACKDYDPKNTGWNSCGYYGTFRQFEIFVTSTSVQFSAPTYSVSQTTGSATITVTRTGDASSTGMVTYDTSDGTAVAGQDYTYTTGTLIFNANETSKTFVVPLLNPASQSDRTVNLTLSQPSGTTLGTQSTAVLTIRAAPSSLGTTFIGVSGASLETIALTPLAGGGYDIVVTPIPNAAINPYPGRIASLAYAPYNKLVTGFTNRPGGPNFCCRLTGIQQINPSTGALTTHVEVESGHSLGNHVNALAVTADGDVYMAGGPQLVPRISSCGINRNCNFLLHFRDSQSFPDGPDFLNLVFTPAINITALAISPSGIMYGWDQLVGLVRVNPVPWSVLTDQFGNNYSDAVTAVSAQGRPLAISYDNPIVSIQFTDDGKLIGIQDNGNASFYEIDTSSGSVKLIGNTAMGISSFARMVAPTLPPAP